MAYNNNIPLGPDRFYISQGDMLQNFQTIFTDTQVNHVVLNDADQGKHKFVQLPKADNSISVGSVSTFNEPAILNVPDNVNTISSGSSCTFDILEKFGAGFEGTDPFRLNINSANSTNSLNSPIDLLNTASFKLPSGILIKTALYSISVGRILLFSTFNVDLNFGIPFTSIYWFTAIVCSDIAQTNSPTSDPNATAYVIGFSNTNIRFRAERRDKFSSLPDRNSFRVRVTVFGKGAQ